MSEDLISRQAAIDANTRSRGKEQTMSIFDQVHKAYTDSRKNNFWDAWGIVASPRVIHELRAECMEHVAAHNADVGALGAIFGLVVIPCDLVDEETVYVVDEQLGRFILKLMGKRKAGKR